MNAIIQKQGTGKTKQLMKAAKASRRGVILTQDKRALKVKAANYGFEDIPIYDYSDMEQDNIPLDANVFVHNGDQLLQYLMDNYYNLHVEGYTATIGEEEEKQA